MKHRELVQIVVTSLAGGFALSYAFPGDTFSFDIWFNFFLGGALAVFFCFVIMYYLQKKLASYYSGSIEYNFYPVGLLGTFIVSLLSIGALSFFHVGFFKFTKGKVHNVGTKKILASRAETAALTGVGVLVGLTVATIVGVFSEVMKEAAIYFALWSLIPLPKTNGFYWFNWHPANTLLVLSFAAIIVLFWQSGMPIIIPLIIFALYYFSYLFVHARRQNF